MTSLCDLATCRVSEFHFRSLLSSSQSSSCFYSHWTLPVESPFLLDAPAQVRWSGCTFSNRSIHLQLDFSFSWSEFFRSRNGSFLWTYLIFRWKSFAILISEDSCYTSEPRGDSHFPGLCPSLQISVMRIRGNKILSNCTGQTEQGVAPKLMLP